MDDGDSKQGKISKYLSYIRDFFQSIRIRCTSLQVNDTNRELLACNFVFLPAIGYFLYFILCLV